MKTITQSDAEARTVALLRAIAHPARFRIVKLLAARQSCVCGELVGERAKQASSCCGTPDYRDKLYVIDEVADLPETVASYGCGNPTAIAGLKEGEVVLDLGSGPGLDCFLSAKQVGASGRVIGLDMTQD